MRSHASHRGRCRLESSWWTTYSRRARRPPPAPQRFSREEHARSISSRPVARSTIVLPDLAVRAIHEACLYSGVLPSGSVVARGSTPVVDASRGRNDPRKATLGRRAWSGLEVSPAPSSARRAGRGCESTVPMTHTGRRRTSPQASVGSKTRSAGREHLSPEGRAGDRRWT
jgi:hypothetical protein